MEGKIEESYIYIYRIYRLYNYIKNNSEPKTEPWGISCFTSLKEFRDPLYQMLSVNP